MSAFNVSRDHSGDAWFRLGRLDVTSTMLLVLLGALGVVASAFVPALVEFGALLPQRVGSGEVWRLVTWPFVDSISLWSVLTLVLLWYFGTDLERHVGRTRMARLYAGMWAVLTITTLVLGVFTEQAMIGLNTLQFLVLLLWIAEYPRRPFFFGIPAWIIGAVLVAVQVLGFIASRNIGGLLSLLVSFAVVAFMARRMGLLSDLSWMPGRPGPRPSGPSGPTQRGPSVPAAPRASRAQQRDAQRRASDAERLDALLEKISEQGLHSLSNAERKELEKLRERRKAR